jgi:predicted membrane-bound spermidine synthase
MEAIATLWVDLSMAELYILFSLTTAFVGLIRVYVPICKRLAERRVNSIVIASPMLSNVIFTVLGFITSPLLFVVLVVPSVNHKFMDAMYDSLSTPD